MRLTFILCTLVLLQLFYGVLPVFARSPKTAKIAFSSNRDGNWEIHLINPDGSEPVNLTQHPMGDIGPVWAPMGNEILFRSNRDGEWDLYLMDANGANVQKVFEELASRSSPSWAPDGETIAYSRDGIIYTATRDGKNVEEVTSGLYPAWSPDGQWLAFVLPPPGQFGLGLYNFQTRIKQMILGNPRRPFLKSPTWTPDSTKLAFFWHNPEDWIQPTVYVLNRDGSGLNLVLKPSPPFRAEEPVWSPHGDELLYEHKTNAQSQIVKIHLGSRREKQLTRHGRNSLGDWFDPAVLPVTSQPQLLTTKWSKLKQK